MANKRVSLSDRNESQIGRTIGVLISKPEVQEYVRNDNKPLNNVLEKPLTEDIVKPLDNASIKLLNNTLIEPITDVEVKPLVKTKAKPLIKTLCEDKGDDINRIVQDMVDEVERIINLENNKSGFISNRPIEKFDIRNPAMAIPAKPEIHDIMDYLAKRFKKYKLPKYLIFEKIFINGLKHTNFEE